MSRFDYVKFDHDATDCMQNFKRMFVELEGLLEGCIALDIPNREKAYWSTALHYAELSYAMIGKAIRDSQVNTYGAALQEERGNE